MGVSKYRGIPKWMVYNGKPYQNGWLGGTTIFGNIHIVHELYNFHISFPPQVLWRTAATTAARQGASFMASGHLHWRKAWPLEGDHDLDLSYKPILRFHQCLVLGHGVVHDKHIVTTKLEAEITGPLVSMDQYHSTCWPQITVAQVTEAGLVLHRKRVRG